MTFLADESVDRQIVDRLRFDGHTVPYVAEMSPGISDDDVLDTANASSAVLVTADKDFGELVFRLGRITSGVVLIRLPGVAPEDKAEIVAAAVHHYGAQFARTFSVVTRGAVRIRRSTP